MPAQIKFYRTNENYDFFSNVTDLGFDVWLDGKLLHARSSEALFQGLKGYAPQQFNNQLENQPNPLKQAAIDLITDKKTPGAYLQKAGAQFNGNIPSAFHQKLSAPLLLNFGLPSNANITMKEQFMYELLLMKATQNIEVLKALLATGSDEIIENTQLASYNDDFWGNGLNGKGYNALGKAWMRVREKLSSELSLSGKILIRNQLSDTLINECFGLNRANNQNPNANKQFITINELNNTPVLKTVAEIQDHRVRLKAEKPTYTTLPTVPNTKEAKANLLKKLSAFNPVDISMIESPDNANEKQMTIIFQSPHDAYKFVTHFNKNVRDPKFKPLEYTVEQYSVKLDVYTALYIFRQLELENRASIAEEKAATQQTLNTPAAATQSANQAPVAVTTQATASNNTKKYLAAVIASTILATALFGILAVSGVGLATCMIAAAIFGTIAIGASILTIINNKNKQMTANQPPSFLRSLSSHSLINSIKPASLKPVAPKATAIRTHLPTAETITTNAPQMPTPHTATFSPRQR